MSELEMEGREDKLLRILRFSHRADPMICTCGASWGMHSTAYLEAKPSTCSGFSYDYANPQNQVKKVFSYWSEFPD